MKLKMIITLDLTDYEIAAIIANQVKLIEMLTSEPGLFYQAGVTFETVEDSTDVAPANDNVPTKPAGASVPTVKKAA